MRKLTAILLCAAVLLSLAACGSTGDGSVPAEPVSTGGSTSAGPANTGSSSAQTDPGSTGGDAAQGGPVSNGDNAAQAVPESGNASADGQPSDAGSGAAEKAIAELEKKYAGLTDDDLTWEYDSASRTVTVSGEGPMKDYGTEAPEWDIYSAEAEKIVIGDKVTSVSACAFLWFSAVTDVRLGESVEYVGESAFDNCQCLWTVNFPAGLRYVGRYAFNNDILHSASGFTFPDGMLYLGDSSFRSAFKENGVYIPASLAHIGTDSFSNTFVSEFVVDPGNPAYCSIDGVLFDKNVNTLINYPADKKDRSYAIPETVTAILSEAFEVNHDLEKLTIPASVTAIEEGAIFWNYALCDIDVDAANSSYRSVDGVLFTKDGKCLLCYPIASGRTEYTVPEGTERICAYALSQAKNLTAIHMNEGLEELGNFALYGSEKLASLGLPGSLVRIEHAALAYCDALKKINYAGSDADWKNVEIGEMHEFLSDGSVKIFCAK